VSKTFSANTLSVGIVGGTITVDPSISPGISASVGAILPRLGVPELWQKMGSANTDWQLVGQGGSYAPGSFSIKTGTHRIMSNHLILASTQRATLQGTARLNIQT
jgi:hypothetical protein